MRLLTYNIHKGIGGRDRRYDLDRIRAVIEDENPDLICLQEVDRNVQRSRFDDQPHLLAEYFHAEAMMFQLNLRLIRGGYGNLLLSRWPLHARHQVSLCHHTKKPRGAQIAVVETPEGRLRLVNYHLGLADNERHWQVKRLLAHRLFRQWDGLPTLVVGDTNDWRNTLATGPFAAEGFEQVSHPPSNFRSFPAYLPMGSLDKVFAKGAVSVVAARVVRSPKSRVASDHVPVVVDFHLNDEADAAGSATPAI